MLFMTCLHGAFAHRVCGVCLCGRVPATKYGSSGLCVSPRLVYTIMRTYVTMPHSIHHSTAHDCIKGVPVVLRSLVGWSWAKSVGSGCCVERLAPIIPRRPTAQPEPQSATDSDDDAASDTDAPAPEPEDDKIVLSMQSKEGKLNLRIGRQTALSKLFDSY